ncbi:class I SAM-dependent methyltransferase [bacterium D16-54]|nr:class I SAM-dependent methyltransferase [bacterium D16-54]RKJ09486.1 class I SAM-dependent methyltransferase [bacterium D16-56]
MKCVICGNENLDVLTKKLRYGNGIVNYCSKCDYGMLEAGFQDASEYYDKEYRKKYKDELTNDREEIPEEIYQMRCRYQKDRIHAIKNFFDKEKSFLEIGCSAGQFLNKIKDEFGHVAGIELSKQCAEYVRQHWNIPVYSEELSQIKWDGKQFDYIGFFQVLEHIEDPRQFLLNVHERLKDGGKVFIEIPNLNDPLRKLWKVDAYEQFYYHEAHLSYFSEKSIGMLLEDCGYKVERIDYIQDYNFLNHVYWYFNNGPQPDCIFGLNEPNIDFKKDGENIQEAGTEINKLLADTNRKYFEILSKYKLTSNLFIIASKI